MSSYPSMEQAPSTGARDIGGLIWRRGWVVLVIVLIALAIAYLITIKTPKTWTAKAMLITSGSAYQNTTGIAQAQSTASNELQMLQSDDIAQLTLAWLKQDSLRQGVPFTFGDLTAQQFMNKLTVDNPSGTSLINVSMSDQSPEKAQQLANGVCKAFVAWNHSLLVNSTSQNIHDLEHQLSVAKEKALSADIALRNFKDQHHLVDLPTQDGAALQRYEEAANNVTQLQASVAAQQTKVKALKAQLSTMDKQVLAQNGFRDDMVYSSLMSELTQAKQEYAQKLEKYQPDFPGMPAKLSYIQKLQQQVDALRKKTVTSVLPTATEQDTQLQDLQKAETTLLVEQKQLLDAQNQAAQFNSNLQGIPQLEMQYNQLSERDKNLRKVEQEVQKNLTLAQVGTSTQRVNVQIAQDALLPEQPSSPNMTNNLLFGGVLGLVLGIATLMLLENTDQRLRTTGRARAMLPGSVIGALPSVKNTQIQALLQGNSAGRTAEAYSLARANLSLALRNLGQGCHVVMVTSALPGEGKSLTAVALARSSARAGKRVILVEADMRRPSMNALFNTSEPTGLAEVLNGEMQLDDVLVGSDVENLTLLYSGAPSCNPSDLIARPQMTELIQALRQEADIIYVDTPPCSVVADALVMAPLADCILQVVSLDMADQPTTLETTAALRAADPRSMVYFINRAPDEPNKSYSSYYTKHDSSASQAAPANSPRALLNAPEEKQDNSADRQ